MTFGVLGAETHTHDLRSAVMLNGGQGTMPSVMVYLYWFLEIVNPTHLI